MRRIALAGDDGFEHQRAAIASTSDRTPPSLGLAHEAAKLDSPYESI
jgi:hypothetical protein